MEYKDDWDATLFQLGYGYEHLTAATKIQHQGSETSMKTTSQVEQLILRGSVVWIKGAILLLLHFLFT
jgi:hypothetical protein